MLADGDVLVVTQKSCPRPKVNWSPIADDDPAAKVALVEQESVRILRRRGDLIISETKHGFICANAGIDLSNVAWARPPCCPRTRTVRPGGSVRG